MKWLKGAWTQNTSLHGLGIHLSVSTYSRVPQGVAQSADKKKFERSVLKVSRFRLLSMTRKSRIGHLNRSAFQRR